MRLGTCNDFVLCEGVPETLSLFGKRQLLRTFFFCSSIKVRLCSMCTHFLVDYDTT